MQRTHDRPFILIVNRPVGDVFEFKLWADIACRRLDEAHRGVGDDELELGHLEDVVDRTCCHYLAHCFAYQHLAYITQYASLLLGASSHVPAPCFITPHALPLSDASCHVLAHNGHHISCATIIWCIVTQPAPQPHYKIHYTIIKSIVSSTRTSASPQCCHYLVHRLAYQHLAYISQHALPLATIIWHIASQTSTLPTSHRIIWCIILHLNQHLVYYTKLLNESFIQNTSGYRNFHIMTFGFASTNN